MKNRYCYTRNKLVIMKTFKQLLMTVAVLLCSGAVTAHNFEVDGIYYKISGDKAIVTYKGSSKAD